LVVGSKYQVSCTVTDFISGSAKCYADPGGVATYGDARSSVGEISLTFTATATTHNAGVASGANGSDFFIDNFALSPVYEKTITLDSASEAADLDIPMYENTILYITITKDGTAKCGEIVPGLQYDLGDTIYSPEIGIIDYSVKAEDDFGNFSITERAYSSRASYALQLHNATIDAVFDMVALYRATAIVWIGSILYPSMITYGFFKNFSMTIPYHDYSTCSLDIEGLT
jgi:hypothetical protein